MLQLYPRVLPVALGIRVRFHFGEPRVFGFGEGWGGLCEQQIIDDGRTGKTFGFCGDVEGLEYIGGFCEDWAPDGLIITTESELEEIVTEDDEPLITGPLYQDAHWACNEGAPWMCEVDVRPYSC